MNHNTDPEYLLAQFELLITRLNRRTSGRWEEIPTGGGCTALIMDTMPTDGYYDLWLVTDAQAPTPGLDDYCWLILHDEDRQQVQTDELINDNQQPLTIDQIVDFVDQFMQRHHITPRPTLI